MKFEIDNKTGMINKMEYDVDFDHSLIENKEKTNSCEIEQILQAVKKTQEKLVNKQIQEIQDSKRPHMENWNPKDSKNPIRKEGSSKYASIEAPDMGPSFTRGKLRPIEKIEQNEEEARLYSALKHIIQSNLIIPHNLISKPDDEYEIDYHSRLKTAPGDTRL